MHCQNIVDGRCLQKEFFLNILLNKVYFPNFANRYTVFWTLSWPFSCDYSFWLRDLKFGICIKDPINKTCWKNGNDLSKEAPKIKLWNHTKKMHFPVFCQKFPHAMDEVEIFFANFQILGPLGCQGWVVIPQNVKKSQNHCTLIERLHKECHCSDEGFRRSFFSFRKNSKRP